MTEESEEQTVEEEEITPFDKEVNRMIIFGVIIAVIVLVPTIVVMWIAS
jgi:hypothetical protein